MSLFRFFLFFILITSYHHAISSSANDATDLIQQTCKNTQHYELCVSSLKSSPLAPSTKVDAKGLALILVNIAIANTTATSSYISSQMKGLQGGNALMMGAMKQCGDKYGFAKDALENAAVDLNGERYDYAYMHVMAAGDYPSGCRSAFRGCPGLVYPAQLAVREEGLKHICDVVLGIVDSLGF